MNRTEYRQARRLIRDNGRAALRWLSCAHRDALQGAIVADYRAMRRAIDPLQVRAWIVTQWGPASPMLRAEMRASIQR